MLELIAILSEKRVTSTREMTLVSVRCLRCKATHTMLEQNWRKHVRNETPSCKACRANPTRAHLRKVWTSMICRCHAPNANGYASYGGRGIKVCVPWLMCFETFYLDMSPTYSAGMTLERRDVNGGYNPDNCRWASKLEQQANKRTTRRLTYMGQDLHLAELCRSTGLSRGILTTRLNQGLSADEAVAAARASTYKKNRRPRTYTTS